MRACLQTEQTEMTRRVDEVRMYVVPRLRRIKRIIFHRRRHSHPSIHVDGALVLEVIRQCEIKSDDAKILRLPTWDGYCG